MIFYNSVLPSIVSVFDKSFPFHFSHRSRFSLLYTISSASQTNRDVTMAPIPATMSGILIEETGGVEVLKWKTDLPVPEIKEGEVLVRNEFVGVNYIDT